MNRVGIGFDVHPLVKGRPLILGGVKIDYPFGLDGHSDADVLVHALMDALLGAAGLRDIGYYFPPGEEKWHDADSLILLGQVNEMLAETGWQVVNADSIIIAEKPTMAPHIGNMCINLASALKLPACRVAVKATTTEGLGFCGRGEGIAAQAVVLIEKVVHLAPRGREAE